MLMWSWAADSTQCHLADRAKGTLPAFHLGCLQGRLHKQMLGDHGPSLPADCVCTGAMAWQLFSLQGLSIAVSVGVDAVALLRCGGSHALQPAVHAIRAPVFLMLHCLAGASLLTMPCLQRCQHMCQVAREPACAATGRP